ncbi:acyl-CoA carboxylase epsilon subunit [Kribbella sp. CA-253562]|uniref:acyl-CoA carboxylase epsilon subunit n=1 Tax=Kribbella sp. CA-253562 TaxID=3239942 RepID=UPI003D8BF484
MPDTPVESSSPILRVVKGDPSPEELAALVAVVSARAAAPAPAADTQRASDWATYWRHAKRPLHPGPGRWRASAHP